MKILILCTGNSCRSQMAQGFLQALDAKLQVYSAGTTPALQVSPYAIMAMAKRGIDISHHKPTSVSVYQNEPWDYVITVCSHAKETCPHFIGTVKHRMHIGFEDPALAYGSKEQILAQFIRVRDEIEKSFTQFYKSLKFDN